MVSIRPPLMRLLTSVLKSFSKCDQEIYSLTCQPISGNDERPGRPESAGFSLTNAVVV
jgi:hypothetical protein